MNKTLARWKGHLRFQKRIRMGRWFTLNLARGSASVSIGVRGLKMNIGKRGRYFTLGVPGTGWSYRGGWAWRRKTPSNVLNHPKEKEGDEPWTSMMN